MHLSDLIRCNSVGHFSHWTSSDPNVAMLLTICGNVLIEYNKKSKANLKQMLHYGKIIAVITGSDNVLYKAYCTGHFFVSLFATSTGSCNSSHPSKPTFARARKISTIPC